MEQIETLHDKITRALDRQSLILKSRDLSCVKILVRIKNGVIQEPEISVDLRRIEENERKL